MRSPKRLLVLLLLAVCVSLSNGQSYGSAVRAIALEEASTDYHWLTLPVIAYIDDSCRGEAADWLWDLNKSTLQYMRDAIPEEYKSFLVLEDECLTVPGLTQGEANMVTSTIITTLLEMGLADLRPGYGVSTYDWVELSPQAPYLVGVSYQVRGASHGDSSLSFGYLFFQYRPDLTALRIHQHRYVVRIPE